jgi:hypothetical protein
MKSSSRLHEHAQSPGFAGDERWVLVLRIIDSKHFVASSRLRDFLLHVTACAIRETPEDATEQLVGIHVFQRLPGFNTGQDSIVRSHARLLRMKLARYFAEEGTAEPIVVEIPKGRYLPMFVPATAKQNGSSHNNHSVNMNGISGPERAGRWALDHASQPNSTPKSAGLPVNGNGFHQWWESSERRPVDILWEPFFGERPMVIYSNAQFFGNSEDGLRYAPANPTIDSTDDLHDHYTGIGEVQSIFQITRLFARRGLDFLLKRSSLVTWDDAKHCNLIFVGSVLENPALRVLPPTENFTIAPGATAIVNHYPLDGEPEMCRRSKHPVTHDFAIVAFRPGLLPDRGSIVFAGLTTLGTQAAVEYACGDATASELLGHVAQEGKVRPFEAVLEATITGGVPLQIRLVAIRVH